VRLSEEEQIRRKGRKLGRRGSVEMRRKGCVDEGGRVRTINDI
jgi:hypothetical protein